MEKVKLSPKFIQAQLEAGVDKETIRTTHYSSLNTNQWKQALKAMNLSAVRAKKVAFEIVDEEETYDEVKEIDPATSYTEAVERVQGIEATFNN